MRTINAIRIDIDEIRKLRMVLRFAETSKMLEYDRQIEALQREAQWVWPLELCTRKLPLRMSLALWVLLLTTGAACLTWKPGEMPEWIVIPMVVMLAIMTSYLVKPLEAVLALRE